MVSKDTNFWICFKVFKYFNTIDIPIFPAAPRWAQRAVKKPRFFENCWRCTTLEDHISGSSWPIWARVCLLERSYSLHLRKNMKIGIYCLLPILEPHQCLVGYNFFGPPGRIEIICGLWRDTHRLSKTSLKKLDTLRVFAKKKKIFLILSRVNFWISHHFR